MKNGYEQTSCAPATEMNRNINRPRFEKGLLLLCSIALGTSSVQAGDLFGDLLGDALRRATVESVSRAREISDVELRLVSQSIPRKLPGAPLVGSNGDLSKTPASRSGTVTPQSLEESLEQQSPAQRQALLAVIESEIDQLQVELAQLNAVEPKTPANNVALSAINTAISTKQRAREFVLGQIKGISPAVAESFAALSNPYFLVCKEQLWAPKDPLEWSKTISSHKDALVRAGRSVGLIMLDDRPAGSGFVVGSNHLITNLHVLKSIAQYDEQKNLWKIRPGAKVYFDVEYPLGKDNACEEPNKERSYFLNAVHAVPKGSRDDMAILLTSTDQQFPKSLTLAERPNAAYAGNMIVAVMGYPGPPDDMTVAEQVEFFRTPDKLAPQFPFKRLSGGFTGGKKVTDEGMFVHKANTSGGNSGSPIFDLSDGAVIGIHVQGFNRFQDRLGYNEALTAARIVKFMTEAGLTSK